MDATKPPNVGVAQRRRLFTAMFLVAAAAAGASWCWNWWVHAPDLGIVIHTEAEATDGARKFLAAARIGTNGYDLSHASDVTTDRLKGEIVWRIVWFSKPDATTTNKLSVLASESGWFYTVEMISTNEGFSIEGNLTDITRQHFWRGSVLGR